MLGTSVNLRHLHLSSSLLQRQSLLREILANPKELYGLAKQKDWQPRGKCKLVKRFQLV